MVIATKYASSWKRRDETVKIKINHIGDHLKSMRMTVDASLKKLRTDYIDVFYVHWWSWETSVEEVMNGLHNLVVQGKVLYLGISDAPAWVVAQANQYAKDHGKTPFVVYQGQWSILDRSFERDIIPMARAFGLALAPWGVLAGGKLRSNAEEEKRRQTGEKGRNLGIMGNDDWMRNEKERAVSDALEKVAKEVGTDRVTAVAIAYVMQKTTHVFPIIGGRKVEHLYDNIEALKISLSPEQIKYLESVHPFEAGFPNSMIGDGTTLRPMLFTAGHSEKWPLAEPIRPQAKN